jgi:LPXTG-site transpeptidase (sortase) family protein
MGLFLVLFPKTFFPTSKTDIQVPTPTPAPVTPSTFGPIKISDKLLENQKSTTQNPLRIVIPSVSIDLSIIEAPVVAGYWELSETTASHGVGSANPGQIGNTVIFAHARTGLFAPLRNIKKSQLIYVLTKDRWYRYQVDQIKEVKETQTQVVAPTTSETLTLFTCSGFLDSKRLIVTAKPLYP